MDTNSKMVRNIRMILAHKSPRISPRDIPMPLHQHTKQRYARRQNKERWEKLLGWSTPPIFDELGIDVWTKKRKHRDNPTAKPAGRRMAPRQAWEDYACELGKHCDAIPDKDEYVLNSLPRPPEKPQPVPKAETVPPKPKTADTTRTDPSCDHDKAKSDAGIKSADGSRSQGDKASVPVEGSVDGQDAGGSTVGAQSDDGRIPSLSINVPLVNTARQTLDHVGSMSHRSDSGMSTDLASRFMLRERIVKDAAAGLLPAGANMINSSRTSSLSTSQVGPLSPPPAVPPRPVRLCYSQSNITLQRPLFPLPGDLPEEEGIVDEDEDEGGDADAFSVRVLGRSATNLSLQDGRQRHRRRRHHVTSDDEEESWSEASDPDDYPNELLPDDAGEQEEEQVVERWPQLENRNFYDSSGMLTRGSARSRRKSSGTQRLFSAGQVSSAGVSQVSAHPHRERATSGRSSYDEAAARTSHTGSGSGGSGPDRRSVSLVLKTMVLDSITAPQRVGLVAPPIQSAASLPTDKTRTQSARSGPSTNSTSVLPNHVTRSVDSKLSALAATNGTVLHGLSQYANPYKDRLPSKGMPIGDLLPAVDTNLRTTLATRRTTPGRQEERTWLTAAAGSTGAGSARGGNRDMTVTGRDTLLPYEDSLILMREGVEMLKMRENSVLGSAGFRAVTTKTPLHRAQENVHKRLYGHLGLARTATHQEDEEDKLLMRVNTHNNKWSSNNSNNHYSAPPRLTPAGPKTTDPSIRGSPARSVGRSVASRSPPPAAPAATSSSGNNTLSSLYKLSRRRKTRERTSQSEISKPPHKLKPPTDAKAIPPRLTQKSHPTPVGPHFRELTELRT